MNQIHWLGLNDRFPNPYLQPDPDPSVPGLIAVSEQIYPGQLAQAYQLGIFPWYSDNQPVLWWSPDPRMVLIPNAFKCSTSLQKSIRHFCQNPHSEILVDSDFGAIVRACATSKRHGQDGTWITHEIINAYTQLHEEGHAHSIAIIEQGQLIGGLYCVSFGKMVFGESMFSRKKGSSKIALAALCAWCTTQNINMIDCQQETQHLSSLGALAIPRQQFLEQLQISLNHTNIELAWVFGKEILNQYYL